MQRADQENKAATFEHRYLKAQREVALAQEAIDKLQTDLAIKATQLKRVSIYYALIEPET